MKLLQGLYLKIFESKVCLNKRLFSVVEVLVSIVDVNHLTLAFIVLILSCELKLQYLHIL